MFDRRLVLAAMTVAAWGLLVLAPAHAATDRKEVSAQPVSLTKSNLGDCCTPEPCCRKPCVTYRHRGPKLCCDCCCTPGTPTTLTVKDPCTGCETEIQVCLPGCCKGDPTTCCGSGFLGRPTVEYEWCCGYSVRVAFTRCGDLIVTTWGR